MTHFSPPVVGLSRRPSFARATLLHPGATSVSKLRSRVDGYATFVYKGLQRTYLLDFYTTPSGPVRTLEAPVSESCK